MASALELSEFLALSGTILDVRSPAEYRHAHIPGAISFPLFSDEERARIGTVYKQQGRDAAVELGLRLVGPRLAEIVESAKAYVMGNCAKVHCWRGGMRSGSVGWLLETAGLPAVTLKNGYKSFRRFVGDLLGSLNSSSTHLRVIAGMTGSGKTAILQCLAAMGHQVLDLEALAQHRGSSYGGLGMERQPSNEQLENEIALVWSRFDLTRPIWVEDESRLIGRCKVPDALYLALRSSPTVTVCRPREERVSHLLEMYGKSDPQQLIAATQRISRRLGGLRTREVVDLINQGQLAIAIEIVLDYYDESYKFGLQQRLGRIISLEERGMTAQGWASHIDRLAKTL